MLVHEWFDETQQLLFHVEVFPGRLGHQAGSGDGVFQGVADGDPSEHVGDLFGRQETDGGELLQVAGDPCQCGSRSRLRFVDGPNGVAPHRKGLGDPVPHRAQADHGHGHIPRQNVCGIVVGRVHGSSPGRGSDVAADLEKVQRFSDELGE